MRNMKKVCGLLVVCALLGAAAAVQAQVQTATTLSCKTGTAANATSLTASLNSFNVYYVTPAASQTTADAKRQGYSFSVQFVADSKTYGPWLNQAAGNHAFTSCTIVPGSSGGSSWTFSNVAIADLSASETKPPAGATRQVTNIQITFVAQTASVK